MKEHLYFNYKRFIPPKPRIYVERIILPLKLPKHTTIVLSQVDINELSLPFLVAKHVIDHMKKVAYVHRMHSGEIILTPESPWRNRKRI